MRADGFTQPWLTCFVSGAEGRRTLLRGCLFDQQRKNRAPAGTPSRANAQSRSMSSLTSLLACLVLLALCSAASLAAECMQPDVPENGHVIFETMPPYKPGVHAKYTCAADFERFGDEERVCLENGTWSSTAPMCALNVAQNKLAQMSSGDGAQNALDESARCALNEQEAQNSWFTVSLLETYSISAISLRVGKLSSNILSIELISNGRTNACDISDSLNVTHFDNWEITVVCNAENVSAVKVNFSARLHICHFAAYSTQAVSWWQCGQGSMQRIGVYGGRCFSASHLEKLDWSGAQARCNQLGGTLPVHLPRNTSAALRLVLSNLRLQPSFYWLGITNSGSKWRWANNELVKAVEEEWADALQANNEESSAVVLARGVGWHWMSIPQSAYNSWICQTSPKLCTSPGVGEFGTVIFSSQSYAVGSACYYSCEPGYKLVGNTRRNCLPTGRWSHSIPQCQPTDCGPLEEWPEGAVILLNRSTTFRSIAEYRCARGTYLSKLSPTHRFCGPDTLWSTPVPFCSLVECGKPQNITNGSVYCSSTTFNSTATYVCDPKFRLVGAYRIYCDESGHWHPTAPLCYDEEAIRAISDSSSVTTTAIAVTMLSVLVALALALRIVIHRCVSSPLSLESFVEPKCTSPRPLIYAAPSQVNDSHIYYASTGAATTEIELPSQLVRVQHLPNGNVHVTLPNLRPITRCPLTLSMRPEQLNIEQLDMRSSHPLSNSPTPSQLLYSFDDEPFYDLPPDEDSLYEEVKQTHANTGA